MFSWENKSVLITGAQGFIGSHLTTALLKKGAKVTTLSRGAASKVHQGVKHLQVSVEDFDQLNAAIKKNPVDVIYHLAALPLVETGQGNPLPSFQINIAGTWNILEAARQNGVEKIVALSTSHVYGDNPNLPYAEEFYPQPSRPYETSKACADLLSQCYADSYGLGVEIPRFVNVYGPGDHNFSRIVPKVIQTVLGGECPKLWDNGAVRDFLYIDDAVNALLLLVEKGLSRSKRNRIFNFGSGQPVKILDLAKQIVELSGDTNCKVEVTPMPEERTKEILEQYVSIDKAKAELGWQPMVSLEEGLKRTIDWYRQHPEVLAKGAARG